ncbi:MAG: GNAT family N-acetyltransferase [Candidatus Bathyarchaeia archaeon]
MIYKLKENGLILHRLYEDCVCYAEEISLIEEYHLWQNVSVYVDDPRRMRDFLVLRKPSFDQESKSLSAYVSTDKASTIREFAAILEKMRHFNVHLQTSAENEPYVNQFLKWLPRTYTVRYCRADSKTFKPHYLHEEKAIRLTPSNVTRLQPSVSSHFIKRIETAPVYAYVDEHGKLVAMSGVGFLNSKSFAISYTETEPEYRNKGIAKWLTSLASDPLINKELIGVYSADITNEPSLRVARALGFMPYRDLKCFYN